MPYRALVSDLDGTLLDTLRDMADAVNIALGRLGFPPHTLSAYKHFVGEGRRIMAMRALPEEHRDDSVLEPFLAYINEEYTKRWMDHSVPYPGIPEMLDALTAAGIRIAVLSNKPHSYAEPMITQILASWSFECIMGESLSVPRKPDPTGAFRILEQMKLKPEECVYIGDSAIDMETAKAAGMYPVGVLWGFRTKEELVAGGARALAQHPRDITALFRL